MLGKKMPLVFSAKGIVQNDFGGPAVMSRLLGFLTRGFASPPFDGFALSVFVFRSGCFASPMPKNLQ